MQNKLSGTPKAVHLMLAGGMLMVSHHTMTMSHKNTLTLYGFSDYETIVLNPPPRSGHQLKTLGKSPPLRVSAAVLVIMPYRCYSHLPQQLPHSDSYDI